MSEKVLQPGTTISLDLEKIMERTGKGKIKIKAKNKSRYALQALMAVSYTHLTLPMKRIV